MISIANSVPGGAVAARQRHGAEQRARAPAPDARRGGAVRDAARRRDVFRVADRGAAVNADTERRDACACCSSTTKSWRACGCAAWCTNAPSRAAIVVGEAANAAQALVWLADARAATWCCSTSHMPGRDGTQLAAELRQPADAAGGGVRHRARRARAAGLRPRRRRLPHQAGQARAPAGRAAARRAAPGAARLRRRRAGRGRARSIVVSDRGRVVRVPLAEVLYLKAELKYVTLRTAGAQLRARRIAGRPGSAPGRALPARAPQRAGGAPRGARARAPRPRRRAATTRAAKAGRCAWRRSTNGWRCRAARWRRCARRWSRQGAEAPHVTGRRAADASGAAGAT